MTDYHEPWDQLPPETRNIHRALTSFKEEIEAVDWYHQRVVLCDDPQLKAVLAHNRDEEIEHATMTLEGLRRNMPKWDEMLRTYLFTDAPITEVEEKKEQAEAEGGRPHGPSTGSLGLGNLQNDDEGA